LEVLNTKSNQSNNNESNSEYSSNQDIKEINSELKRIRNFQSDLSNKFNLVMNVI
jgi:hypothetical protein